MAAGLGDVGPVYFPFHLCSPRLHDGWARYWHTTGFLARKWISASRITAARAAVSFSLVLIETMKSHHARSQNKQKDHEFLCLPKASGHRTSKLMIFHFQWPGVERCRFVRGLPVESRAHYFAGAIHMLHLFCLVDQWMGTIEQPICTYRTCYLKKNTMNVQRAGVTRCDTSVQQWDMDIFPQPLSCSETRTEKGGPPRPWCLWGGPVACLVTVPGGWHAFSGVDHHNQPAPCG